MTLVTLATCNLNQWAGDWEGNCTRIIESIRAAKKAGARFRSGPELEICGYSLLDTFKEEDTLVQSWEMLERILRDQTCNEIIIDVGLPVNHRNVTFNCRVVCLNGRVLAIRPKKCLANDLNYREMRYFSPWLRHGEVENYQLPLSTSEMMGGTKFVPFGDVVLSTPETAIGFELCEELWVPDGPHSSLSLDGVEIITNSSASHFLLRKLSYRLDLIRQSSKLTSSCYLYSNQIGMDGERCVFDGSSIISMNGEIYAQGSQFSLKEVEVSVATIDLAELRAERGSKSRGMQAVTKEKTYPRVEVDFELCPKEAEFDLSIGPTLPRNPVYVSPEEEIAHSTGLYLWDYLRRSGAAGYIIALSGGIDSTSTAVIVYGMCRMVMKSIQAGDQKVAEDLKRITKNDSIPKTAEEACHAIFSTLYLGMSQQSSKETRSRAAALSKAIGAYHLQPDIDEVFNAQRNLVVSTLGFKPQFRVHGGSEAENLALQNIQARSRMVATYEFAQLLPTVRKRPGGGGLLVLSSANVGETLTGYLTKYDCSSGDINPIGSIDKADLKRLIAWAEKEYGLSCLREILEAVPTAELEPLAEGQVTQEDEKDMGMTYAEITTFGRLRKEKMLGAFGMFKRLVHEWGPDRPREDGDDSPVHSPQEVAEKVKKFFHRYSLNRHKSTVLTPSILTNGYSPDDNRFDLRPFLLPSVWNSWSFKKIDAYLARVEKGREGKQK